jgi:xanthine dehydrogenase YagS FAD-binding subunit
LGEATDAPRPIAGGSDLLGELKEGTARAGRLVSLARIADLRGVAETAQGLRLGAGLTLAQLEREPRLVGPYRLLAEAARGVATPEIRNQGTLGGNLCQRPRCFHYRSPWLDCVKKGGSGCPARESPHQHYLSVFGGAGCWAAHASDLAPPLLAMGASVVIAGPGGERTVPLAGFLAGPEQDPRRENILGAAEIVSAVLLPRLPPGWRGTYLKSRERTAGDFPIVSAAFGCEPGGGTLRQVRLVLGGVAPVPRRCPQVEALLEGMVLTDALADQAAGLAFVEAAPLAHNGYKVVLGRALVARIVRQVAA